MKRIINGKRYDTAKAILIGEYSHGYPRDFDYIAEGLYVTPISKSYFIAGEGGANTKYRETVSQNTWSGGEKLLPLSRQEAFEWAQGRLSSEEIEAHFLDLIEEA